jgi:hypothetical protein
MSDMTVVYYTCNADWPHLEQEVRNTITQNCNGLPIVSVSHFPIDFGHNIVVGNIGRSFENVFMQMRLGLEYAKTKYVAICEADFLLPRAFFAFRPPHETIYCWPKDGYITWKTKSRIYYRKRMTQTVGIVGRQHLLTIMSDIVRSAGQVPLYRLIPRISETGLFDLGSVVTLKTRRQMHLSSPHSRNDPVEALPEWGPARTMWRKYGNFPDDE